MKYIFRFCVAIACLALGFWLWTVFFPNPKTVIRQRIDKVAALLTFNAKEGNITKLANVQQLTSYFAANIEITVATPAQSRQTFTGRDEIRQVALAVRGSLTGLTVEFVDQTITLSPDKTEATVSLTGKARVPGDRDLFVQELKFLLRKIDGTWLIIRIETIRTLT